MSYLKFKARLTHPLIHDFLTDIGIDISKGQISNILQNNSKKLIKAYTHLRTFGIKAAPYLQTDATGHKMASPKTRKTLHTYMHFLGNDQLSLFKVTRKYNIPVLRNLITTRGRDKPLISDDGGPNGARAMMKHKQVCWIHEWRHYLALQPVLEIHK
ncbi:MAG TPA: transposase, partial [Candidatus Woesebacteria bacterium]|nr:transposase [Candidatus Woesebacteria bacterium]